MIRMNKKLLGILCIMLAVLMIFSACSKKKKDENNNKVNSANKSETVWENIGDYEINSNAYLDVAAQGGHDKLAGGCYDFEKYAYYVLESKDKTGVICKYDTKDNSLKKTSQALNISDIDGICYKRNTLVILHGGKNITVLDAKSFEVKESHLVIFEGRGIAYNKSLDRYVLLLENGGISVMNSEFEQILGISGIGSTGKMCAITCNNKYIFTIIDGQNGPEIVVYDWNGSYVSTASVSDVRKTAVCVYVDDGIFYIGYDNENGGAVYKTALEKR